MFGVSQLDAIWLWVHFSSRFVLVSERPEVVLACDRQDNASREEERPREVAHRERRTVNLEIFSI